MSEPATEASASNNNRISAVRIERRVRQTRATDCRSVIRGLDMGAVRILGDPSASAVPGPVHSPGWKRSASGATSLVNCPVNRGSPTATISDPDTTAIGL